MDKGSCAVVEKRADHVSIQLPLELETPREVALTSSSSPQPPSQRMESQAIYYPRPDSESDATSSTDDSTHKSEEEDPLPPLIDMDIKSPLEQDLPTAPSPPLTYSSPPTPSSPSSTSLPTPPPSSSSSSSHYSPPIFHRQPSVSDDLVCTICTSLLHDPVSLHCGHSFCQLCLAAMWKTNGEPQSADDLKCPVCRSHWRNFPGVNIQLRKIIEKNYPSQCYEREEAMLTQDHLLLGRFRSAKDKESQWKDKTIANMRREEFRRLMTVLLCCFAFFVVFLLVGVTILLWALGGAEGEYMRKPVSQWTQRDVADWVGGLGKWATPNYSDIFLAEHINGARLLELDESVLKIIGIHDNYRRHSILNGIKLLQEAEFNTPRNFYEFKAANRRETLMVSLFYVMWPRLILLYTYIGNYYDVFLPLLSANFHDHLASNTQPSYLEVVLTFLEMIFLPHFLVAQFVWQWTSEYPWLAYPALVHCYWSLWSEVSGVWRSVQRNWAGLRVIGQRDVFIQLLVLVVKLTIKNIITFAIFFLVVWLLWYIVPSFLCDFLFYYIIWNSVIYLLLWKPFQKLRRWFGIRAQIQMNFNRPLIPNVG